MKRERIGRPKTTRPHKYWRGAGVGLVKGWRGTGKGLARYWRGIGKVLGAFARYWARCARGTGE
eukprot:13864056-Alexandrium_andersonii.AAC.1